MVKDARGFVKPKKEYINPVMEAYKEKLDWLDRFLIQATPDITVKKMISIISKRYGNSLNSARNVLTTIVDDEDYHYHDGFIHKGGKYKCKYIEKQAERIMQREFKKKS